MLNLLPNLGLYIHIPWCIKKCYYCDFNSHQKKQTLPEEEYISCLLDDLAESANHAQQTSISSVYFGGGTPSLFKATSIEKILLGAQRILPFSSNCEITLEVNPGTLEYHSFSEFKDSGINRISLGAQTFQNEKLAALGRVHSVDELYTSLDKLSRANFKSFNVDLMYGLPKQTLKEALRDLEEVVAYHPFHISWYHLTLEPNTLFYRFKPSLPTEDLMWDMMTQGKIYLAKNGFEQYEVSAYSKSGHKSQHNLNYWLYGDYLGIGAGAHEKLTYMDSNQLKVIRRSKIKHPNAYLSSRKKLNFASNTNIVPQEELCFEFMLNALRLNKGFDKKIFSLRTGLNLKSFDHKLAKALDHGYLACSDSQIKCTPLGHQFLNDVVEMFI